jgi:predicted ABC-type ATPase
MNLLTAITLHCYGTSEGVTKAWDTRGRGRHAPMKSLRPGQTTENAWRNQKTGKWNAERYAYHHKVINQLLAGHTAPSDRKPIVTILGGGTGSGKTTLSRKVLGNDPNVLRVDPDELKLAVPEYDKLKQDDPLNASARVHDESSYMTKMAMAQAASKGLDIVYDATTSGNGGPAMAKLLAEKGYDVRAMFVDVPIDVARARAAKREADSTDPINFGRHVPDEVIQWSHYGAADKFMQLKDMPEVADKKFYDNSGKEPQLVYSRSGMGKETINDQDKWDAYQEKASHKELLGAGTLRGSARRPTSYAQGCGRIAQNDRTERIASASGLACHW